MKLRFNLKGADLKGLLVKHVEKIVLAMVVLLAAWLVVTGYGRETPNSKQTPESIAQLAETARNKISQSDWVQVKDQRLKELFFRERAQLIAKTVGLKPYESIGFNLPTVKPETKRIDPELYPVTDLVTWAVVGPMAEMLNEEELLLQEDDEEDEDRLGMLGRGGEQRKRLTVEDQTKLQGGSRMGGMDVSGGFSGTTGSEGTKLVRTQFISVTGMVPIRKQDEEYERCFLNSEEYDPSRDHPRYLYFYLRKREILPDGSRAQWQTLSTKAAIKKTYDWGNLQNEVADSNYVHPMLTYPLPPVLILDPARFGLHPDVPPRPAMDNFGRGMVGDYDDYQDGPGMQGEADGEDLPEVMAGVGRGGGMMDDEGMIGRGGGGRGRDGRLGFGTTGGRRDKKIDIEDPDAEEKDGSGAKRRKYGSFGMDGGSGGSGGFGGSGGSFELLADHYMFRFVDFEVEQGKTYQYQVRLMLEDPNDPYDLNLKPTQRSMAMDVNERLRKKPKRTPNERPKHFYRLTEWSASSPVVYVPSGTMVLAGTPRKQAVIKVQNTTVPRDEPVMNLMMVAFDQNDGYLMAVEQPFRRGAVVNLNKRVNAVDPRDYTVDSRDFNFKTDQVLADLWGGQTLPVSSGNDSMISVGEMLLIDERGNLTVHTEMDDFENYDRYVFEDPKKEGGGAGEMDFMGGFDDNEFGGGSRQPRKSRNSRGNRGRRSFRAD